jgi:aminopeptidase YwaD
MRAMRTALRTALRAATLLLMPVLAPAQRGGNQVTNTTTTKLAALPADASQLQMDAGRISWEDGDFPAALRTFDALLAGAQAARFLGPIAQITGTAWEMTELSADGAATANPQLIWSPSGKVFAFEDGVVMRSGTFVIARKTATGIARVREIDGLVEAISPDDQTALVQLTAMSPELRAARDAIATLVAASNHNPTSSQTQGINAQNTILTGIVSRSRTLSVMQLGTGTSAPLPLGGRRYIDGQFSPDGRSLLIIASSPTDSADVAVWKVDVAGANWQRMTPASVAPGRIMAVTSDGSTLVVGAGGGGGGGRGGGGRGGGGGGRGGGGGAGAPQTPSVWIVRALVATPVIGTTPTVSRSVNAIAYMIRSGDTARIEIRTLANPDSATVVWRGMSAQNPANPAISPDGRRVVFEMTPREDKELYVAEAGAAVVKITHDIPHDRSPMWRDNDYVIALQGEPRHTQSFGYDLKTLTRDRLFHNQMIRTIAPEYAVSVAPDGRAILVAAEGDGNTISPERGAYLMDFDRPVSAASVHARIQSQLADELALRAKGRELFRTLQAPVAELTAQVSVSRIHDYLDTLTSWGSRNATMPGNRKAIDFLARTLRSWGYDVEIQEFTRNGTATANVVATLPGTMHPDAVYVISSHLDSVAGGPGADDDGSGIAILLELARILKAYPQEATIQFGFFTGEESGLWGSQEFVRRFVEAKTNVVGALNNDMVGFANDQRMDNTIRYSNAGIRDVQYAASILFTKITLYSAKYYKSTDAQSYTDALGEVVGGIGSYPVLNSPHYHQSSDVMETISFPQLAETGKATLGSIMYMASSPSQLKGLALAKSGAGLTLSWTNAVEKDVVSYQVQYTNAAGVVTSVPSTTTSVALPSVKPGSEVAVRAVNRAGRYSWDWARVIAP